MNDVQKEADRYCPICETWMSAEVCEVDQVPTIKREILEQQTTTIPEGTILGGRYEVKQLIGMGGMGAVYLGNQTNIHRRVAIKTLKKELMSNERLLKRFYREARAAAALDHPNIVKVYDFGLDSELGCPYIAMEYLEGRSLDDLISEKKQMTEERACQIIGAVARALTDAHSKGVVHRDLKPDNVHVQALSDGTEHIKVLDFGIAKIRHPDGTPTEKLTGTGMALGTPYYMSPEQAMGKTADFRADLYAIGCILYQLLSGRMPFDAEQPMAVLLKQLREPAPPLPDVLCDGREPSAALRGLYTALMAKRPEERPSSTLVVAEQLNGLVRLARGEKVEPSKFVFGGQTLGPAKDDSSEQRGLETLLGDTMGEKETLSFGAISEQGGDNVRAQSLSDADFTAVERRRRTPMLVAAVVLLVGGSAAFVLSGDDRNSVPQTTSKRSVTGENLQNKPTKAAAKPITATPPKTYPLAIRSTPAGAKVFIDDKMVGETPYSGERAATEPDAKVRVELAGYQSTINTLNASAPKLNLVLQPEVVPAMDTSKRTTRKVVKRSAKGTAKAKKIGAQRVPRKSSRRPKNSARKAQATGTKAKTKKKRTEAVKRLRKKPPEKMPTW